MALTKVPSNLDSITATTQSQGDGSTNVATTAYVDTGLNALIDSAPGNLNTLNELAAAMNDNASFFSTVLPLSGGTMTGVLKINDGDDSLPTLAPSTKAVFACDNTANFESSISIMGASNNGSAIINFGDYANEDAGQIKYKNDNGGSDYMAISVNTSEAMRILHNGDVGIGTTSPTRKLSILGTGSEYINIVGGTSSGVGLLLGDSDAEIRGALIYDNATDALGFRTGGNTERMRIDSSGLVGIGQTPSSSDGSMLQITGNDGIQLKRSGQTNGFVIRPNASTDGIRFTQGGTGDRMTIDSSGNVGIATTSPSAQLSVVGNSLTNVSTTGIPAIRAQGGYGGGIGLLDTKEAGWYAQDNGDTLYQYVGRTVGSDTPASKVIMTYKSSGKVGIGETTPDDTLHVNASGGTARLRIGSGNDAYYTSKGYLGDTWYFGSGETGDVVTSTISGGAFTSSNAGGAFVWKTDNSGTLSEKMRIRSDGVVTTPEQCYFLAVRTSNLSGYNFAAVSGAVTPIFTSIVSAQSSASGTAAFSTTDGTFSAPVDGLYLFHISFYSNVTIEQAWLTANGGRISYTDMVANTNASYTTGVFSASIQYYMTAGSSIRIHPYSSGSTSDYVYDNAYHTYWKGVLLG